MDDAEQLARGRFMKLQLVRLGCVAMVMLGAAIIAGRILDTATPGYVLLVLGALGFFLLPNRMAKGWRTPDR